MMIRKRALFALFITQLIIPFYTWSKGSTSVKKLREQGYSIMYVEEEVSIVELAKSLMEENSSLYYMELADFVKNLKRWNGHVKTFTNLDGEYIYTESPATPYLSYEYIPDLPLNKEAPKRKVASVFSPVSSLEEEINLDYTELSATRYTFFAHVTVSQGLFNEQVNGSVLENQQNSPLTFGAGTHIRFTQNFAIATSAYFSKLNASTVDSTELEQSELKIKEEIGGNIYAEYKIPDSRYSVYGGVDHEQFTTLNLDEIIAGSTNIIKPTREKITFLTGGVSFFTKLILPTAIKISGSPVVQSNHDFKGYKYMLYLNQRLTENTWYHFLFKQHQLEQDNGRTVSITRYGFGVGVTF